MLRGSNVIHAYAARCSLLKCGWTKIGQEIQSMSKVCQHSVQCLSMYKVCPYAVQQKYNVCQDVVQHIWAWTEIGHGDPWFVQKLSNMIFKQY